MNSVVGPNFTMPAMPKMPAVPSPVSEVVDAGLMALLRQDVADLPPHIQKAVKETAMDNGVKEEEPRRSKNWKKPGRIWDMHAKPSSRPSWPGPSCTKIGASS